MAKFIKSITDILYSPSSLKNFMECHRKFYFDKTGTPKAAEEWGALSRGNAVHSAIEKYHKNNSVSEAEMADMGEKEYRREWGVRKRKGIKIKTNFTNDIKVCRNMCLGYARFIAPLLTVVSSEAEINFSLPSVFDSIPPIHRITAFTCKLDLICDEVDGYLLADVKTGKDSPTDFYIEQDFQLEMYAYALNHGDFQISKGDYGSKTYTKIVSPISRDKKVTQKAILNLKNLLNENGELQSKPNISKVVYKSDIMTEDCFLKTLNHTLKEIKLCYDEDYWPKHVGSIHATACSFCDYQEVCRKEN